MQFFAFLVCFILWLSLSLPPCDSQSQARLHNEKNSSNQSRCGWQCVVVGADFGKEMKKLITEYRLIVLNLTFQHRVDEECSNQTQVYSQTDLNNQTSLHNQTGLRNRTGLQNQTDLRNQTDLLNQTHLKNATNPSDIWIWLTDNFQSSGENVSKVSIEKSGSQTWFRKSLEGQTEVRVLCDFQLTNNSAFNDAPSTSLNDLIAMVIMKEVADSTGGFSHSGTNICYKESTENGSFVCLNEIKSNTPFKPSQRALGIISIPIAFALMFYSPIILCFFSATEVITENGECVIVINGTSPVGIRSRISNFFSRSKRNTIMWKFGLNFLFSIIFFAAVFALLYLANVVLNIPSSTKTYLPKIVSLLEAFTFIQFAPAFFVFCYVVSLLFTLRKILSFWFTKLSFEDGQCLICEVFGDKKRPVHQGFLEELEQHLHIQPTIVVRCFKYCFGLFTDMFSFQFESVCLHILMFLLLALISVILVPALLVVLPILLIVLSVFFSCPLSSFNITMLLPYWHGRDNSEHREWPKILKIIYSIFSFTQFSPLVACFGITVFLITALSLEILRGILMRLPDYLPYATLTVVVAFYCWKCYSSFTRKYYNLALKLHKHYIPNAVDGKNEQVTNPREEELPVIPKNLFKEACKELMPIKESVGLLVVKLVSLLTFFAVVFIVIMDTPEASEQAKAAATFCTALVPKIIDMVLNKDPGMKELQDKILDKKVKCVVDDYSKNSNISFQNIKLEECYAENTV